MTQPWKYFFLLSCDTIVFEIYGFFRGDTHFCSAKSVKKMLVVIYFVQKGLFQTLKKISYKSNKWQQSSLSCCHMHVADPEKQIKDEKKRMYTRLSNMECSHLFILFFYDSPKNQMLTHCALMYHRDYMTL